MNQKPISKLEKFIALLKNANRIFIFTGAGISTHSGIPDFRGPGGVWTKRAPVYYKDFMASEAARIEHWDYKLESRATMSVARPNAVHQSIVRLESASKVLVVLTQNIDGLHSLSGTSVDRLIELHGTDSLVECQDCHWRGDPQPHFNYFQTHRKTPLCKCGGFLKTATISFGQLLDAELLKRARRAALECDLVIALGSTLSVTPASSFPLLAADRGVPYVIVNRGATSHDDLRSVTLRFDGDVVDIFPSVVASALAP